MIRALALHGCRPPPVGAALFAGMPGRPPAERGPPLAPGPMEGWVSEIVSEVDGAPELYVRLPGDHAPRDGAEGWAGFFISAAGAYIPGSDFRVVRMKSRWLAVCRWVDAHAERPRSREVRLLPPAAGAPVPGARVAWPAARTPGGREVAPPPPPVDAHVLALWGVIDGALEFEVSWPDDIGAEVSEGWVGLFVDEAGNEIAETGFVVIRVKDPRRALCRWAGARSTKLPSNAVRARPPASAAFEIAHHW